VKPKAGHEDMTTEIIDVNGSAGRARRRRDDLLIVPLALALCIAIALAFLIVYFAFLNRPSAPVVYPLATILFLAVIFYSALWWRQRDISILSLGGFAGAMVILYAVYPLLIFLLNHLTYTPLSDNRLFADQPTPDRIGSIAWSYVLYFVPFAAAYLATSGRAGRFRVQADSVRKGSVPLILGLFALTQVLIYGMGLVFDLSASSYTDSFRVVQRLPQLPRQLLVNAAEIQPTLVMLLLCVLFFRYRRYRFLIAAIVLWSIFTALRELHARSGMFVLLLMVGCLYHHFVRRFGALSIILIGILFVALSTWMGIARESSMLDVVSGAHGTSEFETIVANAYDLKYVRGASGILRDQPIIYFGDFISVIPQQLLPFTKRLKADWYLNAYFPEVAASGGGMAFGVVAEAITGWGWMELIVRGALVGVVFGLIHRRFTSRPITVWQFAFYLWLLVWSYQLVRNTTFCILVWSEYHFFMPVIAVRTLHYLAFARHRLHGAIS